MEEGRPSFTAIVSAMMRAAHLVVDGEPKIFSDRLALSLSGAGDEAELRASLDNLGAALSARVGSDVGQRAYRYLRAVMTMRSRYTEGELDQAVRRGIGQYVILGAGLDSFAYRRRDVAGTLRVFEVDAPASQLWKRARLRALDIAEPENLAFVPLDLERQQLVDALRAQGYRLQDRAFVSWLGTTQYLTAEAVFDTLREIASLALGSEIVFQYQVAERVLDEDDRQLLDVLKAGGSASGEPWLSLFDPTALAEQVEGLGFAAVVDFGPEQARTRYFVGRTDDLPVPSLTRLMKARVGRMLA